MTEGFCNKHCGVKVKVKDGNCPVCWCIDKGICSVHDLLEHELSSHDYIQILVPTGLKGILLPDYIKDNDFFVFLEIGYNMPKPIPDLSVTRETIEGTLSFNGEPFYCVIPIPYVVYVNGFKAYTFNVFGDHIREEVDKKKAMDKRKSKLKSKFKVIDGGK